MLHFYTSALWKGNWFAINSVFYIHDLYTYKYYKCVSPNFSSLCSLSFSLPFLFLPLYLLFSFPSLSPSQKLKGKIPVFNSLSNIIWLYSTYGTFIAGNHLLKLHGVSSWSLAGRLRDLPSWFLDHSSAHAVPRFLGLASGDPLIQTANCTLLSKPTKPKCPKPNIPLSKETLFIFAPIYS